MEVILTPSASCFTTNPTTFSAKPPKNPSQTSPSFISFSIKAIPRSNLSSFSSSLFTYCFSSTRTGAISALSSATSLPFTSISSDTTGSENQRHWMVLMEDPPKEVSAKPQIIDYYVKTLEKVLGSEQAAQMSIYDASCTTNLGFCCDIDNEASHELASLLGVLQVKPDPDFNSVEKDYSFSKVQLNPPSNSFCENSLLFAAGTSKHWIVCMHKPSSGLIGKAQMVDYYVQILTEVLGNDKDAQICIYHMSWQASYGFCYELDDEQELSGVSGVLSVHLDENFKSDNKDYGGEKLSNQVTNIKTKKLFVCGLSFYTPEKTLRTAFEGYGELVKVKIIMDKISKRSKGYDFIEYTTEEAANTALKEMNDKIINGWMMTVDVARKHPPKYSRGQPRPAS